MFRPRRVSVSLLSYVSAYCMSCSPSRLHGLIVSRAVAAVLVSSARPPTNVPDMSPLLLSRPLPMYSIHLFCVLGGLFFARIDDSSSGVAASISTQEQDVSFGMHKSKFRLFDFGCRVSSFLEKLHNALLCNFALNETTILLALVVQAHKRRDR